MNVCAFLIPCLALSPLAIHAAGDCSKGAATARKCAAACNVQALRLNDVLAIGTHNSYKSAIPERELALLRERAPHAASSLDYAHGPLAKQLDGGARQLELDVYVDAEGGRFATPIGPKLAGAALPGDLQAELSRPGFKVLHVPDVDFRSTCARFVTCLASLRQWSDEHRDHIPILVLINAKDTPASFPGATAVAPFDAAAFDALDAEIAAVFSRDRLIVPDDVQDGYPTLRDAVLAGNWPTLRDARGKVLFALDESPDKVERYRASRKSLEGRMMFVNTNEDSPAAAYVTLNDPLSEGARIRDAVRSGFLVRTRADADTAEARANDTKRRDAALASGAQYVSTDYMEPDVRLSDYVVHLPGRAAAFANPVRTTACADVQLHE